MSWVTLCPARYVLTAAEIQLPAGVRVVLLIPPLVAIQPREDVERWLATETTAILADASAWELLPAAG